MPNTKLWKGHEAQKKRTLKGTTFNKQSWRTSSLHEKFEGGPVMYFALNFDYRSRSWTEIYSFTRLEQPLHLLCWPTVSLEPGTQVFQYEILSLLVFFSSTSGYISSCTSSCPQFFKYSYTILNSCATFRNLTTSFKRLVYVRTEKATSTRAGCHMNSSFQSCCVPLGATSSKYVLWSSWSSAAQGYELSSFEKQNCLKTAVPGPFRCRMVLSVMVLQIKDFLSWQHKRAN